VRRGPGSSASEARGAVGDGRHLGGGVLGAGQHKAAAGMHEGRWGVPGSRSADRGVGPPGEAREQESRSESQICSYAQAMHVSLRARAWGMRCPISVSRVLVPSAWDGGDHFSRSALAGTLERPFGGLGAGHATLHGLPPGGVCLDRPRSPEASVSLLPHRFTLAVGSPKTPRPAVSSLWHFPCPVGRSRRIGGRYPPPCPVEPGLSSRGA
jgi:hypothetical protein